MKYSTLLLMVTIIKHIFICDDFYFRHPTLLGLQQARQLALNLIQTVSNCFVFAASFKHLNELTFCCCLFFCTVVCSVSCHLLCYIDVLVYTAVPLFCQMSTISVACKVTEWRMDSLLTSVYVSYELSVCMCACKIAVNFLCLLNYLVLPGCVHVFFW